MQICERAGVGRVGRDDGWEASRHLVLPSPPRALPRRQAALLHMSTAAPPAIGEPTPPSTALTRNTTPAASPSDSGTFFSPSRLPFLLMSRPHSPAFSVYAFVRGMRRRVAKKPAMETSAEVRMDSRVRSSATWCTGWDGRRRAGTRRDGQTAAAAAVKGDRRRSCCATIHRSISRQKMCEQAGAAWREPATESAARLKRSPACSRPKWLEPNNRLPQGGARPPAS